MVSPTYTWLHYTPLIAAIASTFLALWKGIIWWSTQSVAVEASLIDSALDACTSCINFWALRTALKPADSCHRYGHDKAEALATLAQSALMVALAGYIIVHAFMKIMDGSAPLIVSDVALHMMAMSTVVAALLVIMQRIAARKIKSLAIQADIIHYQTDVILNAGVFLALWWGQAWLDGCVGTVLAIYLFYSGYGIAKEACNILMDREIGTHERSLIEKAILSDPRVHSLNQLRTRFSGYKQFIQLNIVLDKNISLEKAHTIAHELEDVIQKLDTSIKRDVVIHQEPLHGHEEQH